MDHTTAKLRTTAVYTGYVLCAALVLLLSYYGAYLYLLQRKVYMVNGIDPATGQNLFEIEPSYWFDSDVLTFALIPAHRLDRQLREEFWTTIEHSNGRRWKNPAPPSSSRL